MSSSKKIIKFTTFAVLLILLISIIIFSAGCTDNQKGNQSSARSQDYQKIEPDCPGEVSPSDYDECMLWMEEGSWVPTLVFDYDTPDSTVTKIMEKYFGSYDTEWRIYNFSSLFPQYLDSPKKDYNHYVNMLREKWGFTLNCYGNCSAMPVIAFEKERGDNVILGIPSCPPRCKNCFEEMKEAGIPVKKTKSASTMNYVTDNSNEEMLRVLEEIDEDEDVLFIIKAYLFDR